MFSSPTCSLLTSNRAALFCCDEKCSHPAFGCTSDCLSENYHKNHKTEEWSKMEEDIRRMIELPLSKEELLLLEKQEKQFNILV